ncbi:MAG: excinuclease ABC subunit UvrC [Ruminococcaceae bacterium]|nr:excinuclease ABC subunit UvrC [Oscillospiraceae bacterium]
MAEEFVILKKNELLDKALTLPLSPGVYIMRDKNAKVIYVGKSRALKNRVSQYFRDSQKDIKCERMVAAVVNFDYIITDGEMEALTLENSLIKQYNPKYNIRLKDSKSYPYIKIDMNSPYPKITMTRRRTSDNAKYFGPYSSASAVYSIIQTIQKSFGVASCTKEFPRGIGKSRPCLNSHLGFCMAPCTGKVSPEEYKAVFNEIITFLKGSYKEAEASLRGKMEEAAENLRFEAAARYRDRLNALGSLWQKQKVVGAPELEEDVISIFEGDTCSSLSVFFVRDGRVVDSENHIFNADQIINGETVTSFLCALYMKREYIPKEILISYLLGTEEVKTIENFLTDRAGERIYIHIPQKGEKKALCDMVYENAIMSARLYEKQYEHDNSVLVKLASMLALEVVPERIEAWDISNFGNDNITAGMIVCEGGKLKKSDYRTFKISSGLQDDYGAMREAISRRLAHLSDPEGSFASMPDLILLDGGRSHVSVIRELIDGLGLDIPVFGMVKDDHHKTRALTDGENEIAIAREQHVFVFIYKIQEEVHRYSLARMESAKRKTLKTSMLEDIPGIGKTKAKRLLAHFRSLSAIKKAGAYELSQVTGISQADAERIVLHFSSDRKDK